MNPSHFRFRFRTLLALIACFAVGLWVWVAYLSPVHRWHRTIRSDNDSAARWEAASRAVRGQIPGLDRAEAVATLCSALSDPSDRVRETAASTLRESRGQEARRVAPYLVNALKDTNFNVRLRAAESLGSLDGLDEGTQKVVALALIPALKDKSEDVRIAAGFALTLMGQGVSAIPVMTAAVRGGQDQNGYAALCLALSGSRDEGAVEALRMALGSSDPGVKRASAEALKRLAIPDPLPKP